MLKSPYYYGLKTGVTEAAGPCLSAFYERDNKSFVVVLLGSKSMEARWQEVPLLVSWAVKQRSSVVDNYGPSGYSKKENVAACYGTGGSTGPKLPAPNIADTIGARGRSFSISHRASMVNFKFNHNKDNHNPNVNQNNNP